MRLAVAGVRKPYNDTLLANWRVATTITSQAYLAVIKGLAGL